MQEELQDDFFHLHFAAVAKHLFTSKFIPTVQGLLQGHCLDVEDSQVRATAETLLHVLRVEGRVRDLLSVMYNNLVGEDRVKIAELERAYKNWNRC